jgi:hypothetical protein
MSKNIILFLQHNVRKTGSPKTIVEGAVVHAANIAETPGATEIGATATPPKLGEIYCISVYSFQ